MNKEQYMRAHYPYCIKRLPSGEWIFLNRDYFPVGTVRKENRGDDHSYHYSKEEYDKILSKYPSFDFPELIPFTNGEWDTSFALYRENQDFHLAKLPPKYRGCFSSFAHGEFFWFYDDGNQPWTTKTNYEKYRQKLDKLPYSKQYYNFVPWEWSKYSQSF